MPQAGWCSECGRYVWVTPEGGCQNGHGPEWVSGRYETVDTGTVRDREGARDVRLAVGLIAFALLYSIVTAAVVTGASFVVASSFGDAPGALESSVETPPEPQLPADIRKDLEYNPDHSLGNRATDQPGLPDEPAAEEAKRMSAKQLDALIRREYPRYTIVKRVAEKYSWGADRGGYNYVLASKDQPPFRLLVGVAQLKAGETLVENAPEAYAIRVGDVVMTDSIFAASARKQMDYLTPKAQRQVVSAVLALQLPKSTIVYAPHADGERIELLTADGANAISDAITDSSDSGQFLEAPVPEDGDLSSLTFDLESP